MGRARELATLAGVLAEPPALVLVEGEAGVGKSRLLREVLAAGDYRALIAVCPPVGESLTLGPVVDAILRDRESVVDLRLSGLAGALRPLFPEWSADLPPAPEPLEDSRASRHRLFRALAELIGCLDVSLLVVEDVHWADQNTLDFLLLLTSRDAAPSLVLTYRPEDVPNGSLLLRLSSRLPTGTTHARLTLEPLDVADTGSLISSMLDGEPVSDEFAAFVHQHTDGLPLAIEESVLLMRERADLVRQDGQWVRINLDELQVPPSVRDAVLERLHQLSPPAQRVLESAAVLSEAVEEPVVCAVAGLTGDQARAALNEALASGLLQESDRSRFGFRHALMGRAVYEALPGPDRRRRHLAAGNALEAAQPLPVAQLARHFREANAVGKWSRYVEHAAERAIAADDHTAAATMLNDLLGTAALKLPRPTRLNLGRKLAAAALWGKEAVPDLHRHVVRTLRTVLDPAGEDGNQQAEIRNLLGRLLLQLGEAEECRAELERAVRQFSSHDPVQAAHLMIYLGSPYAGSRPGAEHLRWLRRAADLMTTEMSPVERLGLTVDRATALLQLGEETGWTVAAELPEAAATAEERRQIARGSLNVGYSALLWGRYALARERLDAGLELSSAGEYPRGRSNILVTQAYLDWLTGDWDGLAERVTSLTDRDAQDAMEPLTYLEAMLVAGLLLAVRGDRAKAEEHFRLVLDGESERRAEYLALAPAAALARLQLAEGRVDEALRLTDRLMQTVMTKGIWLFATDTAQVRVEALVAAQQVTEAAELVRAYATWLDGRDIPAASAALATCRALVTMAQLEDGSAAAQFSRAADGWELLPRPYDALLARERQARCQLGINQADTGLALLSEVFEGLSDLGAHGDADRVARDLRAYGVQVRRRSLGRPGYGDELSPSELAVVRLLMTGRTNRQIAERLSLSPKTVGHQLDSARRKLRAPSRTALAVAAVEAGIVAHQPPDPA